MNSDVVKLKKKRLIKHNVVAISVVIGILLAIIIVVGIILAFELPPKNQKFVLEKSNISDDKVPEDWKDQVHAVFAVNLVAPKNMRFRRSIENIKRYTLQVIRSILTNYYDSDAQFVIQTYSIPGKTTISDFCNATCTMRYVDLIDKEQESFISDNPNQTYAVWQYYRYSLGRKPSLYILFVADRASYRDDIVFEKDMIDSNKILEETKLANTTETVFINDTNTAHYFMYSNIISNGGSVSETANLINDKLISYYRDNSELGREIINPTATNSLQFAVSHTIKEIALIPIIDNEKENNQINIQTVPSKETASSIVLDHYTTSSASSTEKSNETGEDEPSTIPKSIFNSTDSSESRNQEEDFIIEKTNIFSTEHDNDSAIGNDFHSAGTHSTTFTSPFLWIGNEASTINGMIATEALTSTEMDSIQSTTEYLTTNIAAHLKTDRENESMKATKDPDQSIIGTNAEEIARIQENREESKQSSSNDLPSFTETTDTMKVIGSSQIATNFLEDSELLTIATTESSDDQMSGKNHELISGNESTDIHHSASIAETINDEIVSAITFSVKSQIFPNEEIFDTSRKTETSSNFIETSTVTQDIREGIQNITAVTDDKIELTITTGKILPMAVFNITLPALLYDAQFSLHINRTNNNYNYLLLDELSYAEELESEAFDPSKIAFNIDDGSIPLENLETNENETYSDFYLDDSLSSVDDTMGEEKFRLANLALKNKYKMESQSETITSMSVLDGSMQADTIPNWMKNAEDDHHGLFSIDGNSSSNHFTKNTVPIITLENIKFPMISQDYEELKKEFDNATSDYQEISETKSINRAVL